jgi:hypothetical protein
MVYLPQGRLAYAEPFSKRSQPFTCDRNARRSAIAHPFGGEQSARFAELCTAARKVLPQISREIRVLRERPTEGKK